MDTSDVLKVFKIARAVGECNLKNFQNITSDHKSRLDFRRFLESGLRSRGLNSRTAAGSREFLESAIRKSRIALYNLFMHSSLTNQKRDILLSI